MPCETRDTGLYVFLSFRSASGGREIERYNTSRINTNLYPDKI